MTAAEKVDKMFGGKEAVLGPGGDQGTSGDQGTARQQDAKRIQQEKQCTGGAMYKEAADERSG